MKEVSEKEVNRQIEQEVCLQNLEEKTGVSSKLIKTELGIKTDRLTLSEFRKKVRNYTEDFFKTAE